MPKFRAVSGSKTIENIKHMVLQGKLQLLHENTVYGSRLFVLSPRGETTAYVREDVVPEMLEFLREHGAGDGLFPGLSQTTAIGPALSHA
jgi:hypothetical protein